MAVLKELSIRARLAYGAYCLEIALNGYKEESCLVKLIDKIWEFTLSSSLDDWQSEINDMSPHCILDPTPGALDDFNYMTKEEGLALYEAYKKLPPFIVSIIDEVINIG